MQSIGAHWASELSQIQETQKREYREFVVKLHDDIINNELGSECVMCIASIVHFYTLSEVVIIFLILLGSNRSVSSGSIIPQEEGYDETPPEPRMEESFTIYLGRHIHSIRCCQWWI